MPDVSCTADALLRKGKVLNQYGNMPNVGYNPQQTFERVDMVEASSEWERQEFNQGAYFERTYFYNAGGDTLRVTGWILGNPPVVDGLNSTPTTLTIGSGDNTITVNGDGFGADAQFIRVYLRWRPDAINAMGGARLGNQQERREVSITSVADEQIVCVMSLNNEWKHSGMTAGATAELVVQRTDLGLESDPIVITLVGG